MRVPGSEKSRYRPVHISLRRVDLPCRGPHGRPRTDARSYEYACHEGNYAMEGMLKGARMLEEEWAEKNAGSSGDD